MGSYKFQAKKLPQDWFLGSVKDISLSFSNLRVPIKSADRKERQGQYRYYGAQGVIDFIDDYIFDGEYLLVAEDGENVKSRKNDIAQVVQGKFWVNNHAHVLQGNHKGSINFLKYVLNFVSIKEYVTGQAQPKLNKAQLERIAIAIPPLEEQQKIAEVLSTVDQKIDLIDQKIAETQKLKTGLMQKLFSKGVGVQDENGEWQPHTEFDSLPTGRHPALWLQTNLNEVCEKIGDGIHSTPKYVEESEFKFVNGNNIKDGNLVITEKTKSVSQSEYEKHRKELSLDTVLLSINGTIGNLAYYDGSKVVLGKSAAYLSVSAKISKEFLYYYLSTSNASKWFDKGLTGTTIKNLSLKAIRNTPIALPSIDEQTAIANVLMEVDKKIKLLKKQKIDTEQLKKGLMQKLLTGEWRVPLDN